MLILPPLFYTQTIDMKQFRQTFLVAPPPPPPPPPAPAMTKVTQLPRRVLLTPKKLMAPTVIPKTIAIIKDEPTPPDAGVVGGVPGGVPGGQLGGVIGGIVGEATRAAMPVAPPPRAPIRVGGRIKAPRALSEPQPVYPALARQARITGVVSLDAVIDTQGNIAGLKAVSGPPLLIPAALEAVRQWKYEPTYLNDEPVAVELIVTVTFHLD
jgi:protein TonB